MYFVTVSSASRAPCRPRPSRSPSSRANSRRSWRAPASSTTGADGRTPSQRAIAHAYPFCFIAENISYEYNTRDFETGDLARGFMEGWKGSPGHRRNMLRSEVTETAVAVARAPAPGAPRYYAVQLFGLARPAGGCRAVR